MKLSKYRRTHGAPKMALVVGAAVVAAAAVEVAKILFWVFLIELAFFIGL